MSCASFSPLFFLRLLAKILGHCWAVKSTITQVMRLKTHQVQVKHPCHTYARCLTTFICNGWAYGFITTSFSRQVLAQIWEISQPKSWVTARLQTRPLYKQWGFRPTQSGSHIHVIHIQGVWQPSYAMDGHMDPSPLHYHGRRKPGFGKSAKILGNCLVSNQTNMQAMTKLETHP